MRKIFLILVALNSQHSLAQFKDAVWCFGDSAGIDFSNLSNPTLMVSSAFSRGDCASVSDSNDSLLFYAAHNGYFAMPSGKVFCKNHAIMLNGDSLFGLSQFNQTFIICPVNLNLIYIFHVDVNSSGFWEGLYYSIVDMTLNGGLGTVTSKNNQLLNYPMIDCVAAVKHGNGRDWWVLSRRWDITNNAFYFYMVSPNGITGPFIQNIGPNIVGGVNSSNRMKFSPDGSKLVAITTIGEVELFDFDRCTGLLSNHQNIDQTFFWTTIGVEFSVEGRFLYLSNTDNNYNAITPNDTISDNPFRLYQYDLDSSNITASKTLIYTDSLLVARGLQQRGPDGKIYIPAISPGFPYPDSLTYYNQRLSVINDPENKGAACNFQPFSFFLGGTARTFYGLPNNPNYELGAWDSSACDTLGVGINEIEKNELSLIVYPNPVYNSEQVGIEYVLAKGKRGIIEMFDANGRKIYTAMLSVGSTQHEMKISLKPGIYYSKINSGNESVGSKFVVVR